MIRLKTLSSLLMCPNSIKSNLSSLGMFESEDLEIRKRWIFTDDVLSQSGISLGLLNVGRCEDLVANRKVEMVLGFLS